jgi:hypothetical protein
LEGSVDGLFEVLSGRFLGGTEENYEILESGVPAEIRTEHLPNVTAISNWLVRFVMVFQRSFRNVMDYRLKSVTFLSNDRF